MKEIIIQKCPFCNGIDLGIGYQQSHASIMNSHSGLSGSKVEYLICKECGSIVHSRVNNPEIFKSNR